LKVCLDPIANEFISRNELDDAIPIAVELNTGEPLLERGRRQRAGVLQRGSPDVERL